VVASYASTAPSLRTKHLAGDTSLDDDQDGTGDRRVSGTNTAEFPEPTCFNVEVDHEAGLAVIESDFDMGRASRVCMSVEEVLALLDASK
jgi:hypothetical protein